MVEGNYKKYGKGTKLQRRVQLNAAVLTVLEARELMFRQMTSNGCPKCDLITFRPIV